jgi:hypothetical protein
MTLKAMIGQILKREVEQTDENIEKRNNARINHTSSLQVKDLQSGKIHNARMCNYSKEGVYFESDSVLTRECRFISVFKIHRTPHCRMFWNITEQK